MERKQIGKIGPGMVYRLCYSILAVSNFLGADATTAAGLARNFADNNVSPAGLPALTPSGQAQFQPGTSEFQNDFGNRNSKS